MATLPVRPLIGALISALVIAMTTVLGAAPVSAEPDAVRPAASSIGLDTDLTLVIAKCEGCVITVSSYDGADPAYSAVPARVTDGSVTITLPSARTAGMSVRVEPPWLTTAVEADTHVVWRYARKAIGDKVSFKEARSKRRASGCWAGTVNEAVTLKVKVRQVRYRGRRAAIAWAPVTESFVRPMERIRRGVLVSDDVLSCQLYP